MTRATSSLPLSSLLVFMLPGCEGPVSHLHDLADQPEPAPTEVAAPKLDNEDEMASDPGSPDACGPRTGRNAQGTCETLHTRHQPHAQQVQIPAGRFVMGDVPRSYGTELGRHDPRERWAGQPPRYAETGSFWIDVHEVTREAYAKCVEAGQCTAAGCEDGVDPVEKFSTEAAGLVPQTCVTHRQAEVFCTAQGDRLPNGTEWEFASRGVDARMYPWGNQLRDEYAAMLLPIGGNPGDSSYFGILGMGTNALEWVSDPYEVDIGLVPYISEPFRRSTGPLMAAEAIRGPRFVMKGGKAGMRMSQNKADRRLGFRCAADLGPDEAPLTVPADPPPIPLVRTASAQLEVFGGVAEAVDRREAEKFCSVLAVEHQGQTYTGWRLPSLDEVRSIVQAFRGPGPFWAAQGAIVYRPPKANAKVEGAQGWVSNPAEPTDALAARCVRDPS